MSFLSFWQCLVIGCLGGFLSSSSASASNTDAHVRIQAGEITIRAQIFIYGEGATREMVTRVRTSILKRWAKRPDGMPWTYLDRVSGQEYSVSFDVAVDLYDGQERQRPFLIPGAWDPFNRSNYIEIMGSSMRSMVRMGDEGKWFPGSSGTFAHEFGHLLGLNDRYHDVGDFSVENPGWEKNLMANSESGVVEQRSIDAIVSRVVTRYRWFAGMSKSIYGTDAYEDVINVSFCRY